MKKMASWKLVLLFAVSFPLMFFKDSSSVNPQKVELSVYYETLCPSCAVFIVKNLESVFNNDLIDIINLRLVPWGYAYINRSANNSIVCQHGPDECQLNAIQACAIDAWRDVDKYYGFISCVEFLAIEGKQQNWQTCFNTLGLPKTPVLDCYSTGNGTKLHLRNGNETAHLNPRPTLLPWVVVNDQPLGNDYANFTAHVCSVYKGNAIPKACKSTPSIVIESESQRRT